MLLKPESVNILGREYAIQYVSNPAEVDIHRRAALWGQIDCWTRSIRVYDNGRRLDDILEVLLHEVIHGIATELNIKTLNDSEDDLHLLSVGLADVLVRNGWIELKGGNQQ